MGFKARLILSYVVIITISFAFIAFFIDRHIENEPSPQGISSSLNGKDPGLKAEVRYAGKAVFCGFLLALALSLILGSILAGRITGPIKGMIGVSNRYSKGDFSRKIIHISKDELGQLAGTLNKMAREIEDKVRQIESQNQRLTAVFDGMIEGVIVVDGSGRILSVNSAAEKVFGVPRDKMEGAAFLEVIRSNELWEVVSVALKEGLVVSKETGLIYPVRKIFSANASPIFSAGQVTGCLVVIHDITEMKKLETMRRDFIANVSHELKTPLTSIRGFVETLMEGALDDDENNRKFLKIIMDHSERLNNLVTDLLALSDIESSERAVDKTNILLRPMVDDIVRGFSSQLKRKNVAAENRLAEGVVISGDKVMIDQVMTNLVDNAIKFNKQGGRIKIYNASLDGGVKIIVEDSGIGIPERDLPRIFERFYRVDKARSRELGGTGLGLSIVKHIVELHGGEVGVESVEGLGSKLWFILPT